jgi:hypothetical protein
MSDQYDFTYTDPSVTGFTVQPQTKDRTSTSLTLTGRGSPNWGLDLQENLLKLLENFASPTPPTNGVTGQLWYDKTNKILHVFDSTATDPWAGTAGGSGVASSATAPVNPKPGQLWYNTTTKILYVWDAIAWRQLYPSSAATSQKIAFVDEYNSMATAINFVIGTPVGGTFAAAHGWGQTDIFALETISTMTNAKWVTLLTKIKTIATALGLVTTNILTDGFIYESENTIPYGTVTMLAAYNATLLAMADITGASGSPARYKPAAAYLESVTPPTGSASHNGSWTGSIKHEVVATFADANALLSFFNSGGQVQFVSTLTGAGTNRDFQWMSFLGLMGSVKYSINGTIDTATPTPHANYTVQLFDLTNAFKSVFSLANPVNAQQTFTINAKLDSANAIRFQLVYADPGTLYGGVGGVMTSNTTVVRASSQFLKSPIIGYPALSQTAFA